METKRANGWIALLVVWVVWGSTYLAIHEAVIGLPPVLMAGARFLLAGLLMFSVAAVAANRAGPGAGWPGWRQWAGCAAAGTPMLGANAALCYAERSVPTGLASLLIATVPLWLLFFDAVLNRVRPGRAAIGGLLAGLAGIGLLSGSAGGAVSAAGVVICLCSAASWALGTVLSRRVPVPASPVLGAAMEMICAGTVLLGFAWATGETAALRLASVPAGSWLAFGYLILVGSGVGFSAYTLAVRELPVSTVGTYAYVNPVIAVLLGATLLGERPSPKMLAGGLLVVAAVALVITRRRS